MRHTGSVGPGRKLDKDRNLRQEIEKQQRRQSRRMLLFRGHQNSKEEQVWYLKGRLCNAPGLPQGGEGQPGRRQARGLL